MSTFFFFFFFFQLLSVTRNPVDTIFWGWKRKWWKKQRCIVIGWPKEALPGWCPGIDEQPQNKDDGSCDKASWKGGCDSKIWQWQCEHIHSYWYCHIQHKGKTNYQLNKFMIQIRQEKVLNNYALIIASWSCSKPTWKLSSLYLCGRI